MTFANATLLAGLGAVVIPIALHLLNKARTQSIEWGAMIFLEDPTDQRLAARWRHGLVLAMRVLAIGLLALAFARPQFAGVLGSTNRGAVALVILIDGSPSMTHPELTADRFEAARRVALNDLARLNRGDQAALIELGTNVELPLTADLQTVASRLASLKPGTNSFDFTDSGRRAAVWLRGAQSANQTVHFIGDRQSSSWMTMSALSSELKGNVHVIATPVGTSDNRNVAIESITRIGPAALVNTPTLFRVRLRNYSDHPARDVKLRLMQSETQSDTSTVDIQPMSVVTVDRPLVFDRPGSQVITARIDPWGISSDDQASIALTVNAPIRVLIFDPQSPGEVPAASELNYVSLALSAASQRDGGPSFVVRTTGDPQAIDPLHTDAQVIIFNDSVVTDPLLLQQLQSFSHTGGGILLAPGGHVDSLEWQVFQQGLAVAPPFIGAVGTGDRAIEQVDSERLPLGGQADVMGGARFKRWNRLEAAPADTVLARLDNGDPLAIETKFGDSRIITLAVPLDTSWSNFPLTSGYLPFLVSVVRTLAFDPALNRNVELGDSLDATILRPRDRSATVARPDGREDRVEFLVNGDQGLFRYSAANIPGRYTLRARGEAPIDFVVRSNAAESDLLLLDDKAIQRAAAVAKVELAVPDAVPELSPVQAEHGEPALPLVLLAALCLMTEMWLARSTASAGGVAS